MKKLFVVSLLFLSLPAFGDIVCDTNVSKYYAIYTRNQYTCSAGQYLPANTEGCTACLYGHTCVGGTYTFNENIDQGITIGTYTCNSGYYLPANAVACVACPTGATCNGGTFTFNPDEYQGITINNIQNSTMNNVCASNFPAKLYAIYTINQHTCAAGQYLPANTDGCTACPNGYTCAGGTFTFDTEHDQGIVANTITINWHGALAADIATNDAGTVTYGGDIRTPVRPDPAQIPVGQRFKGWRFSKPNN